MGLMSRCMALNCLIQIIIGILLLIISIAGRKWAVTDQGLVKSHYGLITLCVGDNCNSDIEDRPTHIKECLVLVVIGFAMFVAAFILWVLWMAHCTSGIVQKLLKAGTAVHLIFGMVAIVVALIVFALKEQDYYESVWNLSSFDHSFGWTFWFTIAPCMNGIFGVFALCGAKEDEPAALPT